MRHVTSIGLDVHARSITAVALDSITGEVAAQRFGNSSAEVASWILKFESPKAVYESGVTGFHLVRELRNPGVDCIVGAVSKMQRPAADKRRKNDRNDAEFSARQLLARNVVEVFAPDEETEAARSLSRVLEDIRDDLTRAKHRLTHLLIRWGTPGTNAPPRARGAAPGRGRTGSGSGGSSFPRAQRKNPSTTTSRRCATSRRRRRPSRRGLPSMQAVLAGAGGSRRFAA